MRQVGAAGTALPNLQQVGVVIIALPNLQQVWLIYAKLAVSMAVQAILGAFPAAPGSMIMLVGLLAYFVVTLLWLLNLRISGCPQIRRQLFCFKALAC